MEDIYRHRGVGIRLHKVASTHSIAEVGATSVRSIPEAQRRLGNFAADHVANVAHFPRGDAEGVNSQDLGDIRAEDQRRIQSHMILVRYLAALGLACLGALSIIDAQSHSPIPRPKHGDQEGKVGYREGRRTKCYNIRQSLKCAAGGFARMIIWPALTESWVKTIKVPPFALGLIRDYFQEMVWLPPVRSSDSEGPTSVTWVGLCVDLMLFFGRWPFSRAQVSSNNYLWFPDTHQAWRQPNLAEMVGQLRALVSATISLWGNVGHGHPWHKTERMRCKHLASIGFKQTLTGLASRPILRFPERTATILGDAAIARAGNPMAATVPCGGTAHRSPIAVAGLTMATVLPPPNFAPLPGCVSSGFVPLPQANFRYT